jgi:hypothetical protein
MAKKKKTRKQKVLSDLRHHHLAPKSGNPVDESSPAAEEKPRSTVFTFTPDPVKSPAVPARTNIPTGTDYHYILHDLKKTTILTVSIIVGQIALFLLVNRF